MMIRVTMYGMAWTQIMIMLVLTKVVDLLNIVRHLGGLSKRGVFRTEIGDQVVVVINDHMFVFVFIIGDQVVLLSHL